MFSDKDYKARIDACVVIAHEYGHSLGYDHDGEPQSVMNAILAVRA